MEMKFRTLSGATVTADPMAEAEQPLALGAPATEQGAGQLEIANLLRKKIERIIRESNGDSSTAATQICVMLDEHLDLAANGWFDDDEAMQNAIIAADQAAD